MQYLIALVFSVSIVTAAPDQLRDIPYYGVEVLLNAYPEAAAGMETVDLQASALRREILKLNQQFASEEFNVDGISKEVRRVYATLNDIDTEFDFVSTLALIKSDLRLEWVDDELDSQMDIFVLAFAMYSQSREWTSLLQCQMAKPQGSARGKVQPEPSFDYNKLKLYSYGNMRVVSMLGDDLEKVISNENINISDFNHFSAIFDIDTRPDSRKARFANRVKSLIDRNALASD